MSITSAIETTHDKGRICLGLLNRSDTMVENPSKEMLAEFELVTPYQAKFIIPKDPKLLRLGNDTECDKILNETILASVSKGQAPKRVPCNFWFPTLENCQNPDSLTGIEIQIYESLVKFREQEGLNPENSPEQEKQFFQRFSWDKSFISASERSQIEALLKKVHTIIARHRLDVGRNDDFKVLLTPEHDKPVYSQSPTTAIHIRDELLTELALL